MKFDRLIFKTFLVVVFVMPGAFAKENVTPLELITQQFDAADSLLSSFVSLPQARKKEVAPFNDVITDLLERHKEIAWVIRTNSKGIVVNSMQSSGTAPQIAADVSSLAWYSRPLETMVPMYGDLFRENDRSYIIWSKPLSITTPLGGKRFGGVIGMALDVTECFTVFGAKIQEPFLILKEGKIFYRLSTESIKPYVENSFTIQGNIQFVLRLKKKVVQHDDESGVSDSVGKLREEDSLLLLSSRHTKISQVIDKPNDSVSKSPEIISQNVQDLLPQETKKATLFNPGSLLFKIGGSIIIVILFFVVWYFMDNRRRKNDAVPISVPPDDANNADVNQDPSEPSGFPEVAKASFIENQFASEHRLVDNEQSVEVLPHENNESIAIESSQEQENIQSLEIESDVLIKENEEELRGETIDNVPVVSDVDNEIVITTETESIDSISDFAAEQAVMEAEPSDQMELEIEQEQLPAMPLDDPGLVPQEMATDTKDNMQEFHSMISLEKREEIYKKELDELAATIRKQLIEKELQGLIESHRQTLSHEIREQLLASDAVEIEDQQRKIVTKEIAARLRSTDYAEIVETEKKKLAEAIHEKLALEDSDTLAAQARKTLAQELYDSVKENELDSIKDRIRKDIEDEAAKELRMQAYDGIIVEQRLSLEKEIYKELSQSQRPHITASVIEKITLEEHERIDSQMRSEILEQEKKRVVAEEADSLRECVRQQIRVEEYDTVKADVKKEIYAETVLKIKENLEEKYRAVVEEKMIEVKKGLQNKVRLDIQKNIQDDYTSLMDKVEQVSSSLVNIEALQSLSQTVTLLADEKKKYKYLNLNTAQTESLLEYLKRIQNRFNIYFDKVDESVRGLMLNLGSIKNKLDNKD